MKSISIISAFLFLFGTVVIAQDVMYTGANVTLTADTLLQINKNIIESAVNKFDNTDIDTIITYKEFWIVPFNLTTEKIKSTVLEKKIESHNINHANGIYTAVYEDPFKIKYDFYSRNTILGIHITQGTGSAVIACKSLTLTQNYVDKDVVNTIEAEIVLESVTFSAGIFSDAIITILKQQFLNQTGKVKDAFTKDILAIDPLKGVEEFVLEFSGTKIKINVVRESAKASDKDKMQHRLVNATMKKDDVLHVASLLCQDSEAAISNASHVCFCKHIFPSILVVEDQVMPVNISNWELKGKIMELYEILPELINYYSPDMNYTVTVKTSKASVNKEKSVTTRKYEFKTNTDLLLTVETSYGMTLKGHVSGTKFFVNQTEVDIKEMTMIPMVQASGKTVLARFMVNEVKSMNEHFMFVDGIDIPKVISVAPGTANPEEFCFPL